MHSDDEVSIITFSWWALLGPGAFSSPSDVMRLCDIFFFWQMVRQDCGFDPNCVDLVSCRLNERTGRDFFSVSVQEKGCSFSILYFYIKDRKA